MMRVSGAAISAVGVKKLRKSTIGALEISHKKKLLRVFCNVVVKAAHAFTPEDPGGLIAEYLGDVGYEALRFDRLQRSLAICKKGIKEKRVVRALVHGCIRSLLSRYIIARDVQSITALLRSNYGQKAQTAVVEAIEDGEGTNTCVGGNAHIAALDASLTASRNWPGHFRPVYGSASKDWQHFNKFGHIATRRRWRMSVTN